MRILILAALAALLAACQPDPDKTANYSPEEAARQHAGLIHELNKGLIGVVSEDLFPPPVASRIYAYTNIAAYEAARHLQPGYRTLAGQLNGLEPLPEPMGEGLYWEVAMLKSFYETAKNLVYRDFMMDSLFQQMTDTLRPQYADEAVFETSLSMGQAIANHITEWAARDGYADTRNMPRYEPLTDEFAWEPTAPLYGEALEPHWFRLRPFVMDSASQFRVDPPIAFNNEEGSDFYKAAVEVYEIVNAAKQEDIDIAVYWDCNPGPTVVDGHSMQVRKQNTPGGHWVGIHSILAKQANRPLAESCATYAKLCAGMADGFIAAWDTKYAHHLLRPETYITRYLDPDWTPKLESPLFPEFTSAHSLISAVAASILSEAYGEVEFYDDTNLPFGLPPKSFDNLWVAAEEAAQSRLLGGIHYVFACDAGFEQGKALGELVNEAVGLKVTSSGD